MNQGTYFSLIPSGVMQHEKLSDGAKITYALILGLSNQYGYCFATNENLSEMRNTSESSLKRHLKELLDSGCITAEYNHRNDRKLYPIITPTFKEKVSRNQKIVEITQIDDNTHKELDRIYSKMR